MLFSFVFGISQRSPDSRIFLGLFGGSLFFDGFTQRFPQLTNEAPNRGRTCSSAPPLGPCVFASFRTFCITPIVSSSPVRWTLGKLGVLVALWEIWVNSKGCTWNTVDCFPGFPTWVLFFWMIFNFGLHKKPFRCYLLYTGLLKQCAKCRMEAKLVWS